MLGKILFTFGVIVLVALVWRTRRPRDVADAPARLINPAPARPRRRWPIRGLAIGAIALMLAASGLLLYDYWRENNEVIFIRVVDASSGRSADYRAARGDIDDRAFTTVDGRRIVLAETERMETMTVSSPRAADQN